VGIGGKTCHFVGVGEKGPVRVKLRARGSSSHGSLPMLGDNAVVKMAKVIRNLASYQPRITVVPEVKRLVDTVAKLEGFHIEVSEQNVDQIIQRLENKSFAGYLTAITRMTVSPNIVHGGVKANIIPDNCEAEVDIRVLPGQDREYVVKELGQLTDGVEMVISQYSSPTFSAPDSEFYHLISNAMQEFIGDATILPSITAGATDSRFLRGIGIPCYGIGVLTLDPTMRQSIHGRDERIDIASLRLKSDFLVRLARMYLGD